MNESTYRGISIRGWIAFIVVSAGLAFIDLVSVVAMFRFEPEQALQVLLMAVGLNGTYIGSVTGFYFGQKSVESGTVELVEMPIEGDDA